MASALKEGGQTDGMYCSSNLQQPRMLNGLIEFQEFSLLGDSWAAVSGIAAGKAVKSSTGDS